MFMVLLCQVMVNLPELLQQLRLKHAKLDLKHHRSHRHPVNTCFSLQLCHVGNAIMMNIWVPDCFDLKSLTFTKMR